MAEWFPMANAIQHWGGVGVFLVLMVLLMIGIFGRCMGKLYTSSWALFAAISCEVLQ